VEISLDGRVAGGIGVPLDGDPESDLAALVDAIQGSFLAEEVWGGWPMCRVHPTRPMWAKTNANGIACWVCEADPMDEIEIGRLGT
jgi:hypothetical protein